MAVIIQTIQELKQQAVADLIAEYEGELGIADNKGQLALIAGSIEDAITTAQVGQTFGNYTLLEHISRQATPVTATLNSEQDPFGTLQDWGITFNNPIKVATPSEGTIDATFTGASNVSIGDQWRANDGTVVEATEAVVIAGPETVTIQAVSVEAGAETNLTEADELTLVSSLVNYDVAIVGTGGFAGGQNDEEQETFRARVLLAIRAHSTGSQADRYQLAALRAPGVTRAFVEERAPSRGDVTVRFMLDDVRSAFGGLPQGTDGVLPTGPVSTGDQKLVEDEIVADKIRPPAANVYITAPIAKLTIVELSQLEPNNAETQAQVLAQVRDLFRRDTAPGQKLSRSQISAAISASPLEISHTLAQPALDIIPLPGEVPVLNNDEVLFPVI